MSHPIPTREYVENETDLIPDKEDQYVPPKLVLMQKVRTPEGYSGTDLHAEIEAYVRSCIETVDGKPQIGGMAAGHLLSFQQWAVKEGIRFIATEQRLYSKELWVAGTCDLIFEKDGICLDRKLPYRWRG
jgi:hypothetical protein